jgi:hypothetical protein
MLAVNKGCAHYVDLARERIVCGTCHNLELLLIQIWFNITSGKRNISGMIHESTETAAIYKMNLASTNFYAVIHQGHYLFP